MIKRKLSDYYYYDKTSKTHLKYKVDRRSGFHYRRIIVFAGDDAGTMGDNGYYHLTLFGRIYLCHRVIYELFYGLIPEGIEIDHYDKCRTNNAIENLRPAPLGFNHKNKTKNSNNKSGVAGVSLQVDRRDNYYYWRAGWVDFLTGRSSEKSFSVNKFGNDKAFDLACKYRAEMIKQQNENGAGYTETHGQ